MKSTFSVGLTAALLASAASAQKIDKPTARDNLDYLNGGLVDNLKNTGEHHDEWQTGWLPKDCQDMTVDAQYDPKDVTAYNVHYDDCGDAWVICWHKDSPTSLQTTIDNFGKLPVSTRGWVRHVIALPDQNNAAHAYNSGGNIAMFANAGDAMTVWVHESGHSLDLLSAYPDGVLSSSQAWTDALNADSAVPDPYSQTNNVEDVAQNTVLASFDTNVGGGLGGVDQTAADKTSHQWGLVKSKGKDGGNLLQEHDSCTHRLENSAPVQVGASRMMRGRVAPNVAIRSDVKIIPPKDFHTGKDCAQGLKL